MKEFENEEMLADEIKGQLEESCAVSLSPSHKGYVVAPLKSFEDCKNMIKYSFDINVEKLIEKVVEKRLRVFKVANGSVLLIVRQGTDMEIY